MKRPRRFKFKKPQRPGEVTLRLSPTANEAMHRLFPEHSWSNICNGGKILLGGGMPDQPSTHFIWFHHLQEYL